MLRFALLFLAAVHACLLEPGTPFYTLGREAVQAMSKAQDAELTDIESLYLTVPNNVSARGSLEFITAEPHVAGTPGDLKMAKYVRDQFIAAGLEAVIDPQQVLLTYPVSRSLDLVDENGKIVASAPLAEDIIESDKTSDTWWRNHTFNGYAPSGNATAPIVYANYGFPEDFEALEAAGVSVKGTIALMRYGKCFRGLKAMNAQKAGAIAAIIYSDPMEDGYAQGSVYPNGPWRPKTSVQRGSSQFISMCAGDPTRAYAPHGLGVEDVCGMNATDLIPSIPLLPISYGDAMIFLESLGGSPAPKNFQGALNITYLTGPTKNNYRAALRVDNNFTTSPVWNVIGKIPGSLPAERDQPVILGNHRDAWVYGAADPNSGTAQMIEVAKGLGVLLKKGWRPLRSIVLASWSGEEYGLLGSTAWGEVNGDSTTGSLSSTSWISKAVAYLNVDTGVSGPIFQSQGTPIFGKVLAGVLGHVKDPGTGKMLSESWDDGDMFALGSGSDYTVFIDHLGIPSLDFRFEPKAMYGVYHSTYDSFEWMLKEGDPTFEYHVAIAQIWGLLTLRLAGTAGASPMPLPFNYTLQAEAIKGYIVEVKNTSSDAQSHLDFTSLDRAQAAFADSARKVMVETAKLASAPDSPSRDREIAALNDRMVLLEKEFLTTEGLPGRKWFRHVLQAPGLYTGYAPKTLPGIYHPITTSDWKMAQSQIEVAADRMLSAAKFLGVAVGEGNQGHPLFI